jgi:hypothetical protein
MDFSTLLVAGIPLIAVIFGLVEFAKKFGLAGKWLTAVSLVLGIGGGVAYQISTAGIPTGFAGWFTVVVFGLALGLTTSGLYDFVNNRIPVTTATPPEPVSVAPLVKAVQDFGAAIVAAGTMTGSVNAKPVNNVPVPYQDVTAPSASMIPPVETGTVAPDQPKGEAQELAQG